MCLAMASTKVFDKLCVRQKVTAKLWVESSAYTVMSPDFPFPMSTVMMRMGLCFRGSIEADLDSCVAAFVSAVSTVPTRLAIVDFLN